MLRIVEPHKGAAGARARGTTADRQTDRQTEGKEGRENVKLEDHLGKSKICSLVIQSSFANAKVKICLMRRTYI